MLSFFQFTSSQITQVSRNNNDLLIDYGVNDQITVKDYYKIQNTSGHFSLQPEYQQIEISKFHFSDGTIWTTEDIFAKAPPPPIVQLPPNPLDNTAYFVNALIDREQCKFAGKQIIYYDVAQSAGDTQGFTAFNAAQISAISQALAQFSAALNVQFVRSPDATPDMTFYLDDLTSGDAGSAAGYASAQTGEVHLSSRLYREANSLNIGTSGFQVLLHEISHALGLKHPFEAPILPTSENNDSNTIMAYNHQGAIKTNLQAFDIAALQYLYGVNQFLNSANNRYTLNDRYIQDGYGIDTLDASTETTAVTLDLSQAGWSWRGQKNTSILADGQSFIGHGTNIENAIGGSANDTLIGNFINNTLEGGMGQDRYILSSNAGNDIINEVDSNNILTLNNIQAETMYYNNGVLYFGISGSVKFDPAKFSQVILNNITMNSADFIAVYGQRL